MKKLLFAAVFAGLAVFAFLHFRGGDATTWPVTNDPPRGTGIVAFGDSLTDGSGVDRSQSYPAQLGDMIGKNIVNLGVPGETTEGGLRRVDRDVLPRNPGIVLLGLGGNDMLQRKSIDQQFANLETIVERIQSKGALVVLLAVDGGLLYSGDHGDRYRELAERTGCVYVPNVLDGIAGTGTLTLPDKIHPNGEGYRLIAEKIDAHAGQWLRR